MSKRKKVRTRGKLSLSRYFQKLNDGDRVSVVREAAVSVNFPKRLQGRTGIIKKKQGKVYVVNIKDQSKSKDFLIEPVHLKKIKITN